MRKNDHIQVCVSEQFKETFRKAIGEKTMSDVIRQLMEEYVKREAENEDNE